MNPRDSHRRFTVFQQKMEGKYIPKVLKVLKAAVDKFIASGVTAANVTNIQLTGMYEVLDNLYYQCGYSYGWSVYKEFNSVKSAAVNLSLNEAKDMGLLPLRKMAKKAETKPDVVTPNEMGEEVLKILRMSLAINVNEMTDSVKNRILYLIQKGYEEGWGYEKTAQMCKDVADIARARRIVRTESVKASNLAGITGAKKTGLLMDKRWISARDNRVRGNPGGKYPNAQFDHWQVNGQVVGIDRPFTGTGEPMQFPGDPQGAAADIINCRCSCSFIVKRDANGKPIRIAPGFFSQQTAVMWPV